VQSESWKICSMRFLVGILLPLACLQCVWGCLYAQLPFYTDDTAVTEQGKWHFEFFNEYDALQLQYPNQRQNTANFKLNYGLPHDLEMDVDFPYLSIYRTAGEQSSTGVGDTNLGIKSVLRRESPASRLPAFATSFYVEFPTGDTSQQLGSGLHDYWLNLIAQKSLSPKTRITENVGYLFAGNTSTGALEQPHKGMFFQGGSHCSTISARRSLLERRFLALTLATEIWENRNFRPWLGAAISFARG
jgi:hypothetical protein